jgi:hypothetical protein
MERHETSPIERAFPRQFLMKMRINISYDNINASLNVIIMTPSIKPILDQIRPGMAEILLQRDFHI